MRKGRVEMTRGIWTRCGVLKNETHDAEHEVGRQCYRDVSFDIHGHQLGATGLRCPYSWAR